MRFLGCMAGLLCLIAVLTPCSMLAAGEIPEFQVPERVSFMSADGHTTLIGYLFKPVASSSPAGAVVMMHGRGGAYSTLAHGVYDASTLSKRHLAWGRLWAAHGFFALLVDGFGPRGYWAGFPRYSYQDRPEEVSEVTVRPLDAYGALSYLQSRPDIAPGHIALQGWSNGGGATLAAMAEAAKPLSGPGFIAAVALYPNCGLKDRFHDFYRPYAPVRVFMGTADEEVSPKRCDKLVSMSRGQGGDISITLYEGATHSFDNPQESRQRVPANAVATADVQKQAIAFLEPLLRP